MTELIKCHNGKCVNPKRTYHDCKDCNIVEQIEHELTKEDMKLIYGGT